MDVIILHCENGFKLINNMENLFILLSHSLCSVKIAINGNVLEKIDHKLHVY